MAPADRAIPSPHQAARTCAEWSRVLTAAVRAESSIRRRAWASTAMVISTGGTTPQNTQRHDRLVVSHAEIGAPSSEGSTQAADT